MLRGLSGSGKTTLALLLIGIYKTCKGTIHYDDCLLEDKYYASLRKQASYLEQDPLILNSTIYENIAIGSAIACPEEVYEAAKLANADIFINSLPNGYDTSLGKEGINLSAGQKQRLALARALIKKPKLLIFDEPTSNIDAESENYIHDTIRKLSSSAFIIVISHKAETINIADEIIELQNNRLVHVNNS